MELRDQHRQTLLRGKSCERCGFDDIRALVFHHKDPTTKKFTILGRIGTTNNLYTQQMVEELDKCEILCANCHAIEHSAAQAL